MPSATIGTSGGSLTIGTSPVSLGISMDTDDYPGKISFNNIKSETGAYWRNNKSSTINVTVYICDSSGGNAYTLFTISNMGANSSNVTNKTFTVSCPNLKGKALYIKSNIASQFTLQNQTGVTVVPEAVAGRLITKSDMDDLRSYKTATGATAPTATTQGGSMT